MSTTGRPDIRLVSVVIPARNAESTIGAQLEAVCAQVAPMPVEVIVVDSASDDGTGWVASNHAGVRVIRLEQPGANRARNAGIAAANGDVVLLCDADDVVRPGWLGALVSAAEHSDYFGGAIAFAALNSEHCQARWGIVGGQRQGGSTDPYPAPMGCNCGFWRLLWEDLGGFHEELAVANDEYEFFWRAGHAGNSYVHVPEAVVEYRLRARSSAILSREFRAGRADVKAHVISRSLGHRADTVSHALRVWVWIGKESAAGIFSTRHRWAALRVGMRRLGRLAESLSSRTLFL